MTRDELQKVLLRVEETKPLPPPPPPKPVESNCDLWDRYAQAAVMAAGPRFFASVQDLPGVAYDAAKLADAMMAERKKRFEK